MPHTLLSRFDLIFLILDPQDEVYDARLARHLVGLYYRGTSNGGEGSGPRGPGTASMPTAMDLDEDDPVYGGDSAAMLRDYIAYAKASRSGCSGCLCMSLGSNGSDYFRRLRQQSSNITATHRIYLWQAFGMTFNAMGQPL